MDAIEKIRAWSDFTKKIRVFFEERDFLEVSTPQLVPAGAFESAIDCLRVESLGLELHTSPEIEMKQVLAQVKAPIFQITKCFRDDPDTGVHLKEFTMLEFYRPHCRYDKVASDTQELMNIVAGRSLPWLEVSLPDYVLKVAGIDLFREKDATRLKRALQQKGMQTSQDDSWEDLFLKLMIEKIEPSFDTANPMLVTKFPQSLSPLSKGAHGWAERFEVYWKDLEIANGCTEIADEVEVRARYQEQSRRRSDSGKKPHPHPDRLFKAVRECPPASGVAIGLDRLFWALYGKD